MGKLDFYLHPKSIAVIGASSVAGKVGYAVIRNIVKSKFTGKVYPINPRPGTIFDYVTYKSVLDVPGDIDVAVVCIPANYVCAVAEECGQKGVKGIIIVAAGFKEVGSAGIERENKLIEICKKYNLRCIGPNVLGNITTTANMSFSMKTPMKGRVAMISQSGAMMTAVLDWADSQKIGFSHFISLGNKCDVDEIDFIEEIADDPETSLMLLYLESVNDGEKFMRVVSKATKKKPVFILKSGISPAGKAAASSHTGALAGDDMIFDLAFKKAGVIRAKTMQELFDYATIFNLDHFPQCGKFSILTNAGGPGIIATDSFEQYGIPLAKFTEKTLEKLSSLLPPQASINNPVDIVGDAPPKRFHDALTAIFEEDPKICAGSLVLVTPQSTTDPIAVANSLVDIHKCFPDRFLVVTFMGGETMAIPRKIMEENSIPCFSFPEPAVKAMKEVLRRQQIMSKTTNETLNQFNIDNTNVELIIKKAQSEGRKMLTSDESNRILDAYGIKCNISKIATSAEEAVKFSNEIGYPIVMKISSDDIAHKSDCGGVILNVKSDEEVIYSYTKILTDVKEKGPKDSKINGIEIQKYINRSDYSKVSEIILGMKRDQQWGPILMVGTGGIYSNYIQDVSFELARDYSEHEATNQLQQTKIYQILKGVRGEPQSDISSLIDTMLRISQLVQVNTSISEMDMNPILLFEEGKGLCAIDVKIML